MQDADGQGCEVELDTSNDQTEPKENDLLKFMS